MTGSRYEKNISDIKEHVCSSLGIGMGSFEKDKLCDDETKKGLHLRVHRNVLAGDK